MILTKTCNIHVDYFGQTEPLVRSRRLFSCELPPAKTLEIGIFTAPWALIFPNLHRHHSISTATSSLVPCVEFFRAICVSRMLTFILYQCVGRMVRTLRLTSDFSGYWDKPRGVPQYVTCPVSAPVFPQRYYKLAR